jgi:hypothetical protein
MVLVSFTIVGCIKSYIVHKRLLFNIIYRVKTKTKTHEFNFNYEYVIKGVSLRSKSLICFIDQQGPLKTIWLAKAN